MSMPTSIRAISDSGPQGVGARALQPRKPRSGFTLIELAIVLVILGVLLSAALVRFPDPAADRLDRSARRMAAVLGYLHEEAALRGRVYRVTVDLDRESWKVESLRPWSSERPDRQFSHDPELRVKGGKLPEGVEFASLGDKGGRQSSGEGTLYFLPEGHLERGEITLADQEHDRVTLLVDGFTGRVSVTGTPRR